MSTNDVMKIMMMQQLEVSDLHWSVENDKAPRMIESDM